MNSFFELFNIIDLENIKKIIESPIPYDDVFELLKKYEESSFSKASSNWRASAAFYENHNAFQKRLKEDAGACFYKDLKLLLKIKFKNIKDPNELITLDVLDSRNFSLILEKTTLIIKLTPIGEDLLFSNGILIEKILFQLDNDV